MFVRDTMPGITEVEVEDSPEDMAAIRELLDGALSIDGLNRYFIL